ncbi:hypothetical protein CHLNCDRAFT_144359 [Chlorella variabilis]|uniref:Uncharacterized protein n=1 Tax=Chlorella variabilis TaxID=554065 RepID=E1ZB94_CHLVA|nr:hypothetical protein CHLNCDRAFT_144359 [Chlorella variabilis]EFN56605.1 hypothetical protein CHLNCDRAFT_144359 [Chlorella variabilis]|eukprot:XP_005848707.1 hypothetical protein CHLNCDRAFT_144359 [Chlorella variabilis]
MEALLPMTVRFSNPIQCGGSWSFVRYHGFFTKNHNRWPIPPLSERPYDVTFIGKLEYEAKTAVSGVTAHRMAAVKALSAFRDKSGHQYKVYVPQGERLEYHDYIGLLKQSKIVISPWGWGEWSHKDFEILMSGCVVVKPRVDIFKLHPPIFEHNVTAISVKEDLSDLEEAIMPFLTDMPRAQAMATRQQGVFRKYAKPEVMAADWDELLLRRMTQAFSKKPAEEWQPHAQLEEVAAVAFQEEEEQRLQDVDRQREEDREQEEEEEDEREERAGKPEEGKEGAKQEQAEEQEGQRQQAEAGDEQEEQEEQAAAAKKVKKEEQGKGKDTATERR